jgi:hypothetical protein
MHKTSNAFMQPPKNLNVDLNHVQGTPDTVIRENNSAYDSVGNFGGGDTGRSLKLHKSDINDISMGNKSP